MITKTELIEQDFWLRLIHKMGLTGMVGQLASNCALESIDLNNCILVLDPNMHILKCDYLESAIEDALKKYLDSDTLKLEIKLEKHDRLTPAQLMTNHRNSTMTTEPQKPKYNITHRTQDVYTTPDDYEFDSLEEAELHLISQKQEITHTVQNIFTTPDGREFSTMEHAEKHIKTQRLEAAFRVFFKDFNYNPVQRHLDLFCQWEQNRHKYLPEEI